MNEFKVGDIVKLKSGSPNMTIKEIIISISTKKPNRFIKCEWFDGTSLKRRDFRVEMLEFAID